MKRLIFIIVAICLLTLSGLGYWHSIERKALTELYIQEQIDTVLKPKQSQLEKAFNSLYQNVRTLTLLPSVRRIEGGNRLSEAEDIIATGRFTEEGKQTVQQIYNNLVANVSVSEIYAVIEGLDYQKGQVPFFMFDTLVFGQPDAEADEAPDPDFPEESESAEYAYFPMQIDTIKSAHPRFDFKTMEDIPAFISPMMRTCDNTQYLSKISGHEQETFGLLYSVPFYTQSGDLKGVISAIIRANAFEAMLMDVPFVPVTAKDIETQTQSHWQLPKPSRFMLSNTGYNIKIADRRNQNLITQMAEGLANRNVFRVKLAVHSDAPWELSYYLPDTMIEEVLAESDKAFFILAAVILGVLLIAIVAVVWITRIRTQLGGSPDLVAKVVQAVSHGDLKVSIPSTIATDSVLGGMVVMLQTLQANTAQALENQRVRQALDNVHSSVMVTDADLNIIYLNKSVQKLFSDGEQKIREQLPHFDAKQLLGGNIDLFHKNPAHQRGLLEKLTGGYQSDLNIGSLNMAVTVSPVLTQSGERIGFVAEWVDKASDVILDQEVSQVVVYGIQGDFSQRIKEQDKSGLFLKLSQNINQLMDISSSSLHELVSELGALSGGDLTRHISTEYFGIFKQLKDDFNITIENLRQLIREIKVTADEINTVAKEIASGNHDLSQRIEEQAASLQQTTVSMSTLTSTVQANTESAKQANHLALGATKVAGKGVTVINKVVSTMESINQSSRKITEIISVIDGIAFQTNILALNAAVEAARAGDQGRGFAVVAGEVRNLAQRAAAAAGEIKALIFDSEEKVESGTKLVAQAGSTMKEIVQAIDHVTDIMTQISTASVEQSEGIQQVNLAIRQMDDVTQQNAALVEETAASAEALEEQTERLNVNIAKFKVEEDNNYSATTQDSRAQKSVKPFKIETYQSKAKKSESPPMQTSNSATDWEEF
jgi:methyl-accepting chemotaxis protein